MYHIHLYTQTYLVREGTTKHPSSLLDEKDVDVSKLILKLQFSSPDRAEWGRDCKLCVHGCWGGGMIGVVNYWVFS